MEADMAHKMDIHRVESQERIVLRDREKSRTFLEKMSNSSSRMEPYSDSKDAFGNLRSNRREMLL
jgi:hypothetical protein